MIRNFVFLLWSGCLLAGFTLTAQNKDITIEDIWKNYLFYPESVQGLNSMKDGLHYTLLDEGEQGVEINQYAYASGEKTATLVKAADLKVDGKALKIEDYKFSADENKLLIATDVEPIYRHSTQENNYVYDIRNRKLQSLAGNEKGGKQRFATLAPQGNRVAFVRNNNLFITDLDMMKTFAITTDGKVNEVINGATDWVYEEEFSFDVAFFWSPDGSKIAYYRFDESQVREFNMPKYDSLYPSDYRFKYPKAGEDNAKVSIHIYDLKSGKTSNLQLGDYEYIPRIKWTQSSEYLTIVKMNRHQDELDLLLVKTSDGSIKTLLQEKSNTYIDISDDLTFLPDNEGFIWSSDRDGFRHLYYYDFNGGTSRQLTKGNWDVTKFYGIDSDKNLYFQAAMQQPMQREIYRLTLKGGKPMLLTATAGMNEAAFSSGMKYFINTHSDLHAPPFVSLHNSEGKAIRTLVDNADLKKRLADYRLGKQEFFQFTTSYGQTLNGWMIKPPQFDPSKKYPVLMHVYGGPGVQTVEDAWEGFNQMWHQMLAQQGYIVVSVDNRGTGARGSEFQKATYLQLGKLETEDQIEAAQWLGKQNYVDASRIGIWGWSYGGYMSSLCILKGNDVFKTAIAVAPVTNWKYYDSIYTERYMRTPQENTGYDENSPINFVDRLKGNYLLIHGTADDNVHFQNTVEMVSALQKAGKQFDLMIYPDKNHGIYGGNTRYHLYELMTKFIKEKL